MTNDDTMNEALGSHAHWALPILRGLERLGGRAPPMQVENAVRELLAGQLNDLQWARVLRAGHIRWAGHSLKKAGLVGGARGVWEITGPGKAYLGQFLDRPLTVDWSVEELSEEEAGDLRAPLETVDVTDYVGYELPVLRVLAKGARDKAELFETLEGALSSDLLPGDVRVMPRGRTVWQYRASWTLSNLKKAGFIKNPTLGRWEITESGHVRLAEEDANWVMSEYRGSKAKVRAERGTSRELAAQTAPPPWPTVSWKRLLAEFPEAALAMERRLRPDLGPSPELPQALSRNLILYGPPGTGKTFLAKRFAAALTGNDEPGQENRWRVVQFHPSYAYEDFVQGLRPALESKDLRYALRKGPFIQICEAAENDPDHFHVLIIDEINRGDPARIFGELLYGLEYRSQDVELALGGELNVPQNLIVVGTMNSVDRSVALVDYALRRRFAFIRIDPDPSALPVVWMGDLLERFNAWLVAQLDQDHAIGHSVFLNPALAHVPPDEAIDRVWQQDVRPLLEEYFFAQPERLKAAQDQWTKAKREAREEDEPAGGGGGG